MGQLCIVYSKKIAYMWNLKKKEKILLYTWSMQGASMEHAKGIDVVFMSHVLDIHEISQ